MKIERKEDWQTRLQDYLAQQAFEAFEPGILDCALFAGGGIKAMTGVDLMEPLIGYHTIPEGFRKLRKMGFKDHVEYAASFFEELPISLSQPGDLAVCDGEGTQSLGIVQGAGIYVMMPNIGFGIIPLLQGKSALRVPYRAN